MNRTATKILAGLLAFGSLAITPAVIPAAASAQELGAYLQCVTYARDRSGIEIFGDAHSWWDLAEGRYERGRTPRVGAVMAFPRGEQMRLGHVATVSRVLDSRRVLLDHANWSPIDGRRGQIERDVLAIDVSSRNDWSEVRVWYAPLSDLGTTPWRVTGFIYPDRAAQARASVRPIAPTMQHAARSAPPSGPARSVAQAGQRPAAHRPAARGTQHSRDSVRDWDAATVLSGQLSGGN